ncbi:hypothetical protein ACHQM5_017078 [Ranunculus cassubicifolius]
MADIAILIAEEYERRTRNFNKDTDKTRRLFSGVSFKGLTGFSLVNIGEKLESSNLVFNPKSSFSQQAFNGVFSA